MDGRSVMNPMETVVVDRHGLDDLIRVLRDDGRRVVGPTVRESAVVLGDLESGADLPDGWGVRTAPGEYRLERRGDGAVFSHSAGPMSWKTFVHPAKQVLWSERGGTFSAPEPADRRFAFVGVRGCDLAAIRTLGTVLGADPGSVTARVLADLVIVAVNCIEPGGVCFCASMGTGPDVGGGYDLGLTERIDEAGHRFVVDVGTEAGADLLARIPHATADAADTAGARAAVDEARGRMGRAMPDVDLRALLRAARDEPVWDDVADRCLTCGNCTMVCPTCFCTTAEDVSELGGEGTERRQRWASCFELDYSHLHGGNVRTSGAARYRQWMTHKLGTWFDQFGSSGCVGCGRCIDWCPVGIDITAEAARLTGALPAFDPEDRGPGP
ncbi:4Fe-4S ferredoxin [Prescottella equi]|nr:4Fe-4S dicluster domain-containing protein [Prescottella equi]NKS42412.1 4Fe-4S ferredoxin [Prescottella equi]ORL91558.1 4Fe-4S ferredoxin [Prescottella equi]ORM15031.1 4Fe-4S ferredoxin [Prescottella equi]QDP08875.1 4Fe-4S ferredoxin [Prescottella equi]UNQ41192.1 4Fe-4S dicluster domain-containing protein [Prescottella equi]